MLLWIIAGVIVAAVCIVGYYQGVIRGVFSTLGLIFAALLAVPLSGVTAPILRIFKVEHPIILGFLAPVLAFLVVLIIFKVAGFAVNRKIDTHYKYHDSDTRRMLFERLTQRLGVCIGVVNGMIYVLLFSIVAYVLGYSTTQFATTSDAPFMYRVFNSLGAAVQSSGMTKAIAGYDPAPPDYYLGTDILADVYHTPLLQQRLSAYPPFLMLAERSEFQQIAQDNNFQEKWARQPSLREFVGDEQIQPLIKNVELYKEVTTLAQGHLPDLREYLDTGVSPKYKDERILGRWKFDLPLSFKRATSITRSLSNREKAILRQTLHARLNDATITANIDNSTLFKSPNGSEQGKWERTPTGKYILKTPAGDVEASIDSGRLYFTAGELAVVFRKT